MEDFLQQPSENYLSTSEPISFDNSETDMNNSIISSGDKIFAENLYRKTQTQKQNYCLVNLSRLKIYQKPMKSFKNIKGIVLRN